MTRTMICVLCPNSCEITAEVRDGRLVRCTGNRCPQGEDYARQELLAPMRNIATSVEVAGGDLPLCSVRLTGPIPKERIFEAAAVIHRCRLTAPVRSGQVVLPDLLGLGVDVIATRNVMATTRESEESHDGTDKL